MSGSNAGSARLGEQQIGDGAEQRGARVNPQGLRLAELVDRLFGADDEYLPFVDLGDDVVVVRVEPLGHLHGGDAWSVGRGGAAPRHGEVGVKADGSVRVFVAFGDGADHHAGVEHVVVEGEVVGRDVLNAGVALERPVAAAYLGGAAEQLAPVYLADPVGFDGPLQFAVRADARKTEVRRRGQRRSPPPSRGSVGLRARNAGSCAAGLRDRARGHCTRKAPRALAPTGSRLRRALSSRAPRYSGAGAAGVSRWPSRSCLTRR